MATSITKAEAISGFNESEFIALGAGLMLKTSVKAEIKRRRGIAPTHEQVLKVAFALDREVQWVNKWRIHSLKNFNECVDNALGIDNTR